MTTLSLVQCPADLRQTFEEQLVKLFFELEAEQHANAAFALLVWMAPTFQAVQKEYAIWEQAIAARSATTTPFSPSMQGGCLCS